MLYDNITKLAAFGEVTVRPLEAAKAPLVIGLEAAKGAGRGAGAMATLGTAGGLAHGAYHGFKGTQGNLKAKLLGAASKAAKSGLEHGGQSAMYGAHGGAAVGGLIGAGKTLKNTFTKKASYEYATLEKIALSDEANRNLNTAIGTGAGAFAGYHAGGMLGGKAGGALARALGKKQYLAVDARHKDVMSKSKEGYDRVLKDIKQATADKEIAAKNLEMLKGKKSGSLSQIANTQKFVQGREKLLDQLNEARITHATLHNNAENAKINNYAKYKGKQLQGVFTGRKVGRAAGAVGGGLALGYGARKLYDATVGKKKD